MSSNRDQSWKNEFCLLMNVSVSLGVCKNLHYTWPECVFIGVFIFCACQLHTAPVFASRYVPTVSHTVVLCKKYLVYLNSVGLTVN